MKRLSAYIFGAIPARSRTATELPRRGTIQRIVIVSAVLPIILSVLLATSGEIHPLTAVIYNLCLLSLFWLISRYHTHRWLPGLALLISTINVVVVSPELVLRTIDFRFASSVSCGGLRPDRQMLFEPDNDLMWKFPSGQPGVNSFGFRDDEVRIPKPQGVRRILFIGDSCTDQDFAGYVEQLLNDHSAGDSLRFECVVMAVPGYSSYQGKIIAEKYGTLVQADVAFVYFGWNDHWLGWGGTDAELGQDRLTSLGRRLCHHSRLAQLALKISSVTMGDTDGVVERVRVPASEFQDNLMAIDSVLSDAGARTVFVTAPSAHHLTGVPSYLIEEKFAPSQSFVLTRHRDYCDMVRNVSAQTFGGLLDLEKELKALSNPDLFMDDGIHYTDSGLRVVAAIVYAYMLNRGHATTSTPLNQPHPRGGI